MRLITQSAEMRAFARDARGRGKSLGLVPTMGALHQGHLSLVRQAKYQCDVVVVSIFVNPTQFGPSEDFAQYPRALQTDLDLLKSFKVDAAFAPGDTEMYPEGFNTFVEPGEVAAYLEGASRPGHFRGVATVVLKLFNIVSPDVAYFGQKDFQQVQVIRRLVEDLNLPVRLVVCPIVREPDGLARSSRNSRLSAEERQAALTLHRCLRRAEEVVHAGETDAKKLLEEMRRVFAAEPRAQPDYVAIVEPARLRPIERVIAGSVALVAARVGTVRLIDNLIFGPPGSSPELLLQLALTAPSGLDTSARIPGLETEALRLRIESCRDCAALSSILLPPRDFLVKYLKSDYPDLGGVRVAVIGRDAPVNPENFLYHRPEKVNRFVSGLYELLGVKNFGEFKGRFVLTDAIRCHATETHVPEKALAYCVKHLRDELKLFPNLETIVLLGEDAYLQFQKLILTRDAAQFKPFNDLLKDQGWAREEARVPFLGDRMLRVIYCYHPTFGYTRSPSVARLLE
jgi:pantoate--beta-alanine ligase